MSVEKKDNEVECRNEEVPSHCSICMDEITTKTYTRLNCLHTFHTDCYTSFIAHNIVNKKESIKCPMCRDTIIQVIIKHANIIHIIPNSHNHSRDGDEEDNYDGDYGYDIESQIHSSPPVEVSGSSCTCPSMRLLIAYMLKLGMIGGMLYIVFMGLQCGSGHVNALCNVS